MNTHEEYLAELKEKLEPYYDLSTGELLGDEFISPYPHEIAQWLHYKDNPDTRT